MAESNYNTSIFQESDVCKQCTSIVSQQNSICCDICNTCFHLKCTRLTLQLSKIC